MNKFKKLRFFSFLLSSTILNAFPPYSHAIVAEKEGQASSALAYQSGSSSPITLGEREILYSQANKLTAYYEKNTQEIKKLNLQKKETEQDLLSACKESSVDRHLLDIMASGKENLINTLSSDKALALGNLSRIVYEKFDSSFPYFYQNKKQTELDSKINSQLIIIDALKSQVARLSEITNSKGGLNSKRLEKLIKDIKRIDESIILSEGATVSTISEAITSQITKQENQLRNLEVDKKIQNDDTLRAAQELLNNNLLNNQYRVEGVFYRNNGEFSGLALYDEKENKLTLAFAGSKTKLDWVKNLFGWNAHADARGGYFSDIKFHAGFISHFNDSFDSVMSGVNRWLESYRKDREKTAKTPLIIEGTGHSLGGTQGAIFALAAKQLFNQKGVESKVQAVTFGTPNIVHGASVSKLNDLFGDAGNFVRFEDTYDMVPVAAFWKDNPGVSIRYNPGLFHDINGNLEIVPRNTHSSEDYYRFSATALKLFQEKVTPLKPFAQRVYLLKQTIENLEKKNIEIVKESNKQMIFLSQLDANNIQTFVEDFKGYQQDLNKKIEDLRGRGKLLISDQTTTNKLSDQEYLERVELLKQEIIQIQKRMKELKESVKRWSELSKIQKKDQDKRMKEYEDFFNTANTSLLETSTLIKQSKH